MGVKGPLSIGASVHSRVGESEDRHPQTPSRFASSQEQVMCTSPDFHSSSFCSVPQHLDYVAHTQGPLLLNSLVHSRFLWKDLQTSPETCFSSFPCIFQSSQVDKQDQPSQTHKLNIDLISALTTGVVKTIWSP